MYAPSVWFIYCPTEPSIYYPSLNNKQSCFHTIASQVNHLALNTDYALRTGAFDPSKGHTDEVISDHDALKDKALQRYTQAKVQHCCPKFLVHLVFSQRGHMTCLVQMPFIR